MQAPAQAHRLFDPGGERVGSVEAEDAAAARLGVEPVGEEDLDPRALVAEGQGFAPRRGQLGQAAAILLGLRLDPGQRRPRGLGLDGADGLAIDEEEVVGEAGLERKLPYCHAARCAEIELRTRLHGPAGIREHCVDYPSRGLFRQGHTYSFGHAFTKL